MLGKPVIYDVHESYPAQIKCKPWIPSALRTPIAKLADVFELLFSRFMSVVIVAGKDIEARFDGTAKILLRIENFPIIDKSEYIDSKSEKDVFTFVNFGGVWSARTTGEQVESLGFLSEDQNIRLVLGGRIVQDELYESIQRSPGWPKVEYVGLVDRETMVRHLNNASAAMVLYSDHPNHQSIRSNRVYEAMAAGLPVIVSDFPEWREFIAKHKCGIAVNPEDTNAIADAFRKLASNPEESREMGLRGQRAVLEIYNWNSEAKKLISLYEEIISNKI
jgi:glycosyltransferase involved in cell wall biosynthesis